MKLCENVINYMKKNPGKSPRIQEYIDTCRCDFHFQPERSKREDNECCKKYKQYEQFLYFQQMERPWDENCIVATKDLLQHALMRCSELHGNMKRDK